MKIMHSLWKAVLLLWALLCLVVFMYFPGALSQIHDATLNDFPNLVGKFSMINLVYLILDTIRSFIGMAFFGASCLSLGIRISAVFDLWKDRETDSNYIWGALLPTSFLIGNAFFSLIFLVLATLFRLSSIHVTIILCLGLLSGLGEYRKISKPVFHISDGTQRVILYLCFAILSATLFQSSARISYDASSTYFSYAKLTALRGQAAYFLDNTFVVSILHSTIIYSAILQVFGDQTARMISWLLGAATIPFGLALARFAGVSQQARRILPALILTSTAFIDLMGDGKVDLFSSAYSIAAVYWFLKTDTTLSVQRRGGYILAGCLIGFACILRPQNTFLLGMFVLIHTLQQWKSGKFTFTQVAHRSGWVLVGISGFLLYHLALNKIMLGSPFAFLDVIAKINPSDGPWDYNPRIVWVYRLLYPFVITFKNSGASLGNISPLILAFFPAVAMTEVRKRLLMTKEMVQVYTTTALVLLVWIFLFFTVVEARYVFFLWSIIFILAAEWIAGLLESQSMILKRTTLVWIVTLMCYILIRSLFISVSTYSPIGKEGNPQCFDTIMCDQVANINVVARPGERILALSAFRYYLREDLFACSTDHNEYQMLGNLPTSNTEKFYQEVYRNGFKYIVYEKGYALDHIQLKIIPTPQNTPDWIKLEPIFGEPGDKFVTYRIEASNPLITVEKECRKDESTNTWEVKNLTP